MTEHKDTYSRNAQAEQALEFRDRQTAQWSLHRPPEDSLIPPGQVTRTTLPEEDLDRTVRGPQVPSTPVPRKEQKRRDQRTVPKSPLSPDRESQMKRESQSLMLLSR